MAAPFYHGGCEHIYICAFRTLEISNIASPIVEIKGLPPEGNTSNCMETLLFQGFVKSCQAGGRYWAPFSTYGSWASSTWHHVKKDSILDAQSKYSLCPLR